MPNAVSRLISRILPKASPVQPQGGRGTGHAQLSAAENDNTFFIGARRYDETDRDRLEYNRQTVLQECFEAWRDSPLARRIVELTSQYVVGNGFDIKCKDAHTAKFVDQFWHHRLNRMPARIVELCDELTRTGNLFILLSTDKTGMSFIRAIPAVDIDRIISSPNDIEQPLAFTTKVNEGLETFTYTAYNPLNDTARGANGEFPTVLVHYAINRPAGAQWGEPDLSPLLPWLRRYSAWLEDRVRLNRFRNAFLYVVSGSFISEEARLARQQQIAAHPPAPGSVQVTDSSETWSVISPKLEALDAREDGLALKKLIAAGVGLPMHFLAEPEGATRTTAESAGGPTFRRFEQRQQFFTWLLTDLLQIVVQRRAQVDFSIPAHPQISVSGADISARDNVAHSIATVNILNALERLYDMGLIASREVLRAAYRPACPLRVEYTPTTNAAVAYRNFYFGLYCHPSTTPDTPFFYHYNAINGGTQHANVTAIGGNFRRYTWSGVAWQGLFDIALPPNTLSLLSGFTYSPYPAPVFQPQPYRSLHAG
ncbi:MAG: hypothetical protein GX142_00865 [Chloroflexi bacterium]|nr:hypothetical protein [Chloroflexota bacterium]